MSRMEHLFMQIFDRKQRIEDQLKHQVESYGESLAYNMLAEGKQPPPWLWTTEFGGGGYHDLRGLNAERVISGILFPMPHGTTTSANNSTYFPLPAFMGNEVCQSNKAMEPCISKPSDVEGYAEFDPSTKIHHSDSRQRDKEIHLGELEKNAHHLGEMSIKKDHSGRLTRSRALSGKVDNVRESSAMNHSCLYTDRVRANQASLRSTAQPDCPVKSSELLKSLNCIDDCVCKGAVQIGTHSVPSLYLNHHSSATTGNVMVHHTCPTTNAEMEHVLHTTSHANPSLNMSSDVSILLPHSHPLAAPKKRIFDGIEEERLNKRPCISSEKKNLLRAEISFPHRQIVQPVNRDLFLTDLEHMDGSKNVQGKVEIDASVSNYGTEQDGLELLEVEDSESHAHPASGPLSLQKDVNMRSSLESLPNVQHNTELKEALMTRVNYRPPEIISLVESKDPEFDNCKNIGLNVNSIAGLEETKGGSSDIAYKKLKVLESETKEITGGDFPAVPAHVSLIESHLQEAVLADMEVAYRAEETGIVLGVDLEDRLELLDALVTESVSLPGSNNRLSDKPAVSHSKIRSGNSQMSSTCSSLDAECKFDSSLDFPGQLVALPDIAKKRSLKTPIQSPTEEESREKFVNETRSGPIQLTNNVQNDALGSKSDNVLEAETAAVKSIVHSTVILTPAETDDTVMEFHHGLRNLNSNGDNNSSSVKLNDSALPSSNNAIVCFSDQAKGNPNMGFKELSVAKISSRGRAQTTQSKVLYSSRSSAGPTENLGSYLTNGSLSSSVETSVTSLTDKHEISVSPKDTTEKHVHHNWITPNSTEAQGAPTKGRYFLRSLSSHDLNVGSLRQSTSSHASCFKQGKENIPHACEISWPKRRKVEYRSNNILATSPRIRVKHSQRIKEGIHCSYKKEPGSRLEFQPISISAEIKTGTLDTASETPSDSVQQSEQCNTIEGSSYLKENNSSVLTLLPRERAKCDIAVGNLQGCLKDETKMSEAATYEHQKHSDAENFLDSLQEISGSPCNYKDFSKDNALFEAGLHMHDTSNYPHYDASFVCSDETMPEFEGFSIASPSFMEVATIFNDYELSSFAKEHDFALEQQCKSRNIPTPVSCTSAKYKIHKVPDVYQSVPEGVLERMSLGCPLHLNNVDMEQRRGSDKDNMELQFDYSFVGRQYSYSLPSSSTRVDWKTRKPPLTPPVVKFGQKVVSGQSSASLEKVGSNPELVCFRIDENSSIADEDEHCDELDASEEEIFLRESKELINRKPVLDITSEYQNEPSLVSKSMKFLDRDSLESVNSESYFRTQMSAQSSLTKGHAGNMRSKIVDKVNDHTGTRKVVRKAALSLRNRSTKPRVSVKISERSRSHGNLEKGGKPSNLVSNITSFVPLVHEKQHEAPLKGRKDIKVKALEVAEAAKHLEEKKQHEREMRKAAAVLEREKLGHKRCLELKQKQKEEEKKKKEADIAARKRQRQEVGMKDKERKRRCVEETRRNKREQDEKPCPEKVDKKAGNKVLHEKQPRKEEIMEAAKGQKSEKAVEAASSQTTLGIQENSINVLAFDDRNVSNIIEASVCSQNSNVIEKVASKSYVLQEALQKRIIINKDSRTTESYEMSPYRDSDDEDGAEETRREMKCIPLWASRECLDQVILSKRHIDPMNIFSRKHSFILSEVLPTRIHRQPF